MTAGSIRGNEAGARLTAGSLQQFLFQDSPIEPEDEEEGHEAISKGGYYPVRIGDINKNKHQVDGKLGKGLGSTVWLANEFR